jgi:CarboxypepD_reg-like domain/TonB-dependent Receptor Plug Domain
MKTIGTILMTVLAYCLMAQTKIEGKVSEVNGSGIPGANVSIADSYDGASTDEHGRFSFTSSESGTRILNVTFVGFKSVQRSLTLNGTTISIDIILKEDINQLGAVVISAGSFTAGEEKRRTILKAVDVATTAGATADIAGALNTLPGTQKVGESGRLFVRGGDGNETRTFIDGMLVLDPYGPAAPNTPSRGRFLPFMFKGTSFSTGGYSAEYGQALSSALVLNSKDNSTLTQTDIGILSVGGDVAHTQAWEKASLSGKFQYTNLRPYLGLIRQRVDWVNPPTSLEGITAFRTKIGHSGLFKFFGTFNTTEFSLFNHDIQDPTIKQLIGIKNNYSHGNASYHQPINERWVVKSGVSYTKIKNDNLLDDLSLGQDEIGIHAKTVAEYSPTDQIEIKFGAELIDRKFNASRWNVVGGNIEKLTFHESLSSGFAESQIFASSRFVAKAGLRFEHNSLNNQSNLDPRLSLAYKPGKKGQFAFAYGKFRQSPKNELLQFNNQLQAERAEHFILNYQLLTDRRTFRVEAYYKKYDALVKFNNGNPFDLNNSGSGFAQGLEIFWRDSETIKNVDYWVSYSFLNTERNYLNFPSSAVPSFASAHNLSVVYKHFITSIKSQIGLTYSITSGRHYHNPNHENFHAEKTPFYQDLSANISYLPKNWIIIFVSCTNLLGRDNIFGYEYATAPNPDGQYSSRAIRQPATRFAFLGIFITLSKNKSVNQLPNL